ncbi:hypothetical protein DOTSEDRAFT_171295 [Dothistroma septosporum NZE10]|uniref:OsmC-like protein n=1 Tax=Dothistroma septosporum (strain NZE10 / CBS 128990) TaxID=675120 RepID=N1PTI3_DOTSN|nr:hypothetical protein DOTSEDRAFT_171295 [Dothistroma septosporum NZE10]
MKRALRTFTQPVVYRTTRTIRPFSSTFARQDTIPFHVDGQGTGVAQAVGVKDTPHTIYTDAYPAFGGNNVHPSPLHFNLAALSSCTQVTGSIVAKDHGIRLKEWKVSVTGHLDPAVLVGGAEGNGNWNSITLDVEVAAEADAAKFDKWTSEVERRCPVTQLFKRSGAEWSSKWVNKN